MPEIKLEKIHSLLQHLADYVMTEIPILKQDAVKLKQNAAAPQQDVSKIRVKVDYLIEGMDAKVRELNIIRTEQAATERTRHAYNERTAQFALHLLSHRVRDIKNE